MVAAIGFWFWRGSGTESTNTWVRDSDAFAAYCTACKKDISFSGAEAKSVAKQGDKIQCPICKKFEAKWGPAPPAPQPAVEGGLMQP